MAAPKLAKIIGVKVAAANIGEYVILRNLDSGRQLTAKISGTDRNVVFNIAPDVEWNNEDRVQAEISGSVSGFVSGKIQSGGANLKIAASADTSTAGVSL